MEKGRSLSFTGGKGHAVDPAHVPEWLREELRIGGALDKERAPFVYCEYWSLKALAQGVAVVIVILAAGAALTMGGIV